MNSAKGSTAGTHPSVNDAMRTVHHGRGAAVIAVPETPVQMNGYGEVTSGTKGHPLTD